MRLFSSFFKRAAKTTIGIAADSINQIAINVVTDLADKDYSGDDKRRRAKMIIKTRIPNIKDAAINLAIEAAFAIIKDGAKK